MKTHQPTHTDLLIAASRRALWGALTVIVLLSVAAIAINVFPNSALAQLSPRFFQLLPILIVVAVVATRKKSVNTDPEHPAMKAVLHDELRVHSVNTAYRYGFFSILIAQPLFALLFDMSQRDNPWLMSSATLVLGVVVVLATILFLDR